MKPTAKASPCKVTLLPSSPFSQRARTDLEYLLALKERYLLQSFYTEAGLWHGTAEDESQEHKGWESHTCQLRGHFLGHWLSAAALLYDQTGDQRLKGKADYIVSELSRCQERNGRGWAASIPEKYLEWVARGEQVWAPHYTIHKLFMGLVDVVKFLGNQQALEIAVKFASWFTEWTNRFPQEQMQDILDVETGGMMESFADLYELTGDPIHLELVRRYEHSRLFDRLLAGEDILTNIHANTTIPEVHGVCRAWELTGEDRWWSIMTAYWKQAVEDRPSYVTGGQTLGEIWTGPDGMASRLGYKNQEHCTVYNMIRLADFLYRQTGEVKYQDYIELNLYNGVLAQCFWEGYGDDYGTHSSANGNLVSTVVTYFLANGPGSRKNWSSATEHFFCCHGSAVQACASFQHWIYRVEDGCVTVNQYIPSTLEAEGVRLCMERDPVLESTGRPTLWRYHIRVEQCGKPLKLRIPAWCRDGAVVSVDGAPVSTGGDGYQVVGGNLEGRTITVDLPLRLTSHKLAGDDRYAFREGPVALAALTDKEVALAGDPSKPEELLAVAQEREWTVWNNTFLTKGQRENIPFRYLYEIYDQPYTTYFPFQSGN